MQNHLSVNHGELDGHDKCTIVRVIVQLFELECDSDTVIVEYVIHSDIPSF